MPKVRVNGVDLSYEVRGSGPPVVLVAGTGYPGASWPARFLDALSRAHRVLTFDHRGTGASQDSDGPYSTRMLAEDALGLVDRVFGTSADVVGHSMGGRVAQWMALDAPASVRSLVLAATGAGPLPGTSRHETGLPPATVERMVEAGYERFIRDSQRNHFFTDSFAGQRPEEVDRLFSSWWSHRPSLRCYLKHVLARQQHDTVARLTDIRQPALVLVGEADTALMGTYSHLEQSHYLATALPRATLKVLPGLKHGLFWEAPRESARAVMSWLEHR
ncbi:alpha/beta fold hydrolase [Amycolatopsis alkalitolerans]|uniref:Alpha/beta hydrolase n=1 Tax=Amycolatopsis alkalitolerans TaxID=2547244 RepID=A0A5C4M2W2_9PSEU|nr:alpha/beta hydrolase [Amycolatopsis alkalitolerans]TNC25338.1 alpha/beta hydrolase [Amycolatopsis alkalitolerans]